MFGLFLLATAAHALPAAPPMKMVYEPYEAQMNILCWPSGLQVIASREETDRHVAISTVIEGGDASEQPDARGAAHLLEHLWFRSSPKGTAPSTVWDASTGLAITASTRMDSTVYTTIGSPSDLPALLALEAQRLADPLVGVTAAVVASEREVVKREFLQRGGETTDVGLRLLDSVLFPADHPYHGTPLTAAILDALTLEDVKAYASWNYRPAKTTIRLEGDVPVDTDSLSALMETAFGSALAGRGSDCMHKAEPRVPDAPAATIPVADAPIWYQRFYVGWALPPGHDASVGVMEEAAWFVGGVLRIHLDWIPGLRGSQEGRGSASCFVVPAQLASELVCVVDVPQGVDPAMVERGIRDAVGALWHDAQDYRYALWSRTADYWVDAMDQQTSVGLYASERRALWSHFSDEHDVFRAYGAVGFTDEAGLVAFGRKWVTPERMGIALLRPVPGTADRPATSAAWTPRVEAPPATRWTPVDADLDALTSVKLERGLTLWISSHRRRGPGLAQTALAFRGGYLDASEAGLHEALQATATWNIPVSTLELEQSTATQWWTFFDRWSAGAASSGSAGNLDAQLWQTAAFLTFDLDFNLRQEALDDGADVLRDPERALDYILAEPWLFADARRRGHLLGLLPGALPWWERNHAARAVRSGPLEAWRDTVFRPDEGVLVVAGAVDPAFALAQADKYVGNWKGPKTDPLPPPPAPGPAPEARIEVVPVVRSLTQVAVSCRVPGHTAQNEAALDVLSRVVQRGMWQTFREDGRTYTPNAWIEPAHPEAALLTLEVDVLPGEAKAAVGALRGLLGLVAKGAPAAAVDAAKKDSATAWGLELADTTATIGRLTSSWSSGATIDDVRAWRTRLAAVDSAALSALLSDCVGHEAITVIGSDDPASLGTLGPSVEVHEPRELARILSERMD